MHESMNVNAGCASCGRRGPYPRTLGRDCGVWRGLGSAKMFIGMKQVLKNRNAVAITVNCLGGCYKGKLQAYREGASVRAITPVGYPVTTVQLDIPHRLIAVQTGRSFSNDPDDRGCRTKMVVEVTGDFEKAYRYWNKFGWHRVTFLGDFKKDVEAFARKIGYKVVHES